MSDYHTFFSSCCQTTEARTNELETPSDSKKKYWWPCSANFSLKPAQGEASKDRKERIVQCGIALTYCWGGGGRRE
jgi:hypothetical protein